jgi:hypothetical protein
LEKLRPRLRYLFLKEKDRWFELIVEYVCDELVAHQRMTKRTKIASGEVEPKNRALSSLYGDWEKWLNWPLSTGKSLRDATKKDLLAESAFYRSQGRTMMARSDWLAQLAAKMGDSEIVGQAYEAKQIAELHEETQKLWAER